MGGRGSYSVSSGKRKMHIRLLGHDSSCHPKNAGGNPDSRSGVEELAKMAGFAATAGTDEIGTQSMGAYTSAIGKLERKYGALKAVPTTLAGADGTGFYAAAGGSDKGAVLMLNRKAMANAAKHAKAQGKEEADGFKMPTDGKLTSRANYTVTHEYGHLLQNALYQKAKKNGYTGTRSQHAKKAYKSIQRTAFMKYGATIKSLSRYGRTNEFEAFAESFANLNSGSPNAFGKAMGDYLKKNKL